MSPVNIDPRLVEVGIENLPVIIATFRALFQKAHPNEPVPSDAEFVAAAEATFQSEHAKNIDILKSHPAT